MNILKKCGITKINTKKIEDIEEDDIITFMTSKDIDIELYHCIHSNSKLIILDNSKHICDIITDIKEIENIKEIEHIKENNLLICAHINYIIKNSKIDDEGCTAVILIYNNYAIKIPYYFILNEDYEDHKGEDHDHEDHKGEDHEDHNHKEHINKSIEKDAIIGSVLSASLYEKYPYMPKYNGLFYCDNMPISIMEQIKGNNLKDVIYKIKGDLAISIFKRIILFLYISFKTFKFIHGDLHSENIMIINVNDEIDINGIRTYGMKPIIIDFGGSYIFKEYETIDQSNQYIKNEIQLLNLCKLFNFNINYNTLNYPDLLEKIFIDVIS